MSLQALFEDRKIRKNITESVFNGNEMGSGECDSCGHTGGRVQVKGYNLCDSCCRKVLEGMKNYEIPFIEISEDMVFHDLIHETYLNLDQQKFRSEAKVKFGDDSRDSLSKLLQSYGLKVHKDFDDRWNSDGRIFVIDADLSSGKTRINQFLIDFDGSFVTARMAQKLVPDADGTLAPVGTSVPNNGSNPASVTNTSTKSSSKTNTPIQAGPGVSASGTDTNFEIKLADGVEFSVIQAAGQTYSVMYKANNNGGVQVSLNSTKKDDLMREVIDIIKSRPHDFFPAIDSDDFKNGYTIEKYAAYSFIFDDKSFDGRNISLCLALNGKPYENSRVYLTVKDLDNRLSLNKSLQDYIDNRMKKIYPYLYDGTADVKTSVGKAVTYLIDVNPSTSDKLGDVSCRTEIGNIHFDWVSSGSRFQDKESTRNGIYDVIYSGMHKLIPSWNDPKIKSPMMVKASDTNSFSLDLKNPDMTVYAGFDLNDLYDTGNIILKMSIVDTQTGEEQPKELKKVIYKKAGVDIIDFLSKEARSIHKEYFDKSTMSQTLKMSARDKMKVPSKKNAFLEKVKYNLLKSPSIPAQLRKDLGDLEIDFDVFDVNKDGKVTSVVIRVSDPDEYFASDARDLAKYLDLEKKIKWLNFTKADSSPKAISNYGASVVYTVSDIEGFAESSNLAILEALMFAAFNIVTVNESGRKQIFA